MFASASAQQITGIDLGIHDLILEVGESYTFEVTYEPEDPPFNTLFWFVTDDSVIAVDGPRFTLEALRPGEADIFAESFDRFSYDVCHVTVSGSLPKDAAERKSGISFITLSEQDRAKITSYSLNNFLEFLDSVDLSEESFAKAGERVFSVTADVIPGSEEEESLRAQALGIIASGLTHLNLVTLNGTFEQILSFVETNENLKEVFEVAPFDLIEPVSDFSGQKAITLEGCTEDLTSVSAAHNCGFTGNGTTIAIIDTSMVSSHPEYEGRVIAEKCFSGNGTDYLCKDPDFSAEIDMSKVKNGSSSWDHGAFVTGIDAGKGGIAPDAKIVFAATASEYEWQCTADERSRYPCRGENDRC